MYKGDLIALQNIHNNTICVKTNDGIRNMFHSGDINDNLVYVSNIPTIDMCDSNFIINSGEYCRYIDIVVLPKKDLNKCI